MILEWMFTEGGVFEAVRGGERDLSLLTRPELTFLERLKQNCSFEFHVHFAIAEEID